MITVKSKYIYNGTTVLFFTFLCILVISDLVAFSINIHKINTASGLLVTQWEVASVRGLWVFRHYDQTFGHPVAGNMIPGIQVLPVKFIDTYDATPYIGFFLHRQSWYNGQTVVIFPQWILLLLAGVYPFQNRAIAFSSWWERKFGSKFDPIVRRRCRFIILGGAATIWITLAFVGLFLSTINPKNIVRLSRGFGTKEKVLDTSHQIDIFASQIWQLGVDNNGFGPGPTLADAIHAINTSHAFLVNAGNAQRYTPMLFADQDPWGHHFIYIWSGHGQLITIASLGPDGHGSPYSGISLEKAIDLREAMNEINLARGSTQPSK